MENIDSVPSNVQSSRQEALLYMFEDNGWSLKAEVLQWDMFPGLTELHSTGSPTEPTWIPKSKPNTSTPKTNSQTC